ncbi:MAG: hypothetical protein PVF05_05210 [Gemmatimonadales bacterium]|jgi:uncharacterized membrane protein YkgB
MPERTDRSSTRNVPGPIDDLDRRITRWMADYGITLTRLALGVVFLWFGIIKLGPGWSPAADLAANTIDRLTFGLVGREPGLVILAIWESLIGLGFLTGRFLRVTILLLAVQMPGTMMPLFLFPAETFNTFPYAPTLEGQYIIKNFVLISAAIVIGATVRGGRLLSERAEI